jgi:hypothetical protein
MTVPRHGEAVDQAAESRIRQEPRPRASVRGVSGVRGKKNPFSFGSALAGDSRPRQGYRMLKGASLVSAIVASVALLTLMA